MARVAMVTRTIQSTKVKALCVDINEQKPFENEFVLSGTYKDAKSLMKALEKVANTNTIKVVHVKASEIVEKLYGMTEQKFLEIAKELPPRGTKENKELPPRGTKENEELPPRGTKENEEKIEKE